MNYIGNLESQPNKSVMASWCSTKYTYSFCNCGALLFSTVFVLVGRGKTSRSFGTQSILTWVFVSPTSQTHTENEASITPIPPTKYWPCFVYEGNSRLSTDDVQPFQGDDTVAGGASTLIAIVVAHLLNCNASGKNSGEHFSCFFFLFGPGPPAGVFCWSPSELFASTKKSVTGEWAARPCELSVGVKRIICIYSNIIKLTPWCNFFPPNETDCHSITVCNLAKFQ